MNGPHNPLQRFLNDHEPISPHSLDSPPWGASTTISSNLDERVLRGPLIEPKASDRSAFLFHQLPEEVIQRILWAVDSNGFASLCLLNPTWYRKSQHLELYAHHLSRCPSYALSNNVITGPFRKNDLYRLKTKFAAEVRRNLFAAYLRPRETIINLISVSANSSAAFPGGEAFRFEFSPNGQTVLALSSSRIYVLDAASDTIEIQRELKTVRRPLSASVTDDGSLLAVLSSKYQANIYGLTSGNPVKHLQVIVLDNPPRTIALAHEGTVLAAAWTGGIEVFSLAHNALSTDRRAVRSEAVDSLAFSGDGSMIVGTSHDLEEPNAVVITAPFYSENDPNITPREIHSRMWTTQILFPQISSTVSHVALLPGHTEGDTNWVFAYDHPLMTYRAVRTDDTRSGVVYFLSPPTEERFEFPQPCVAPSATACGTLAAAGFHEHGLFLYGVPERLDVSPDMGSVVDKNEERVRRLAALTSATGHIEPLMAYSPSVSGSSQMIDMDEEGLTGKVDWRQSLFVKSKAVRTIEGFTCLRWVENSEENPCEFSGKRLVVTAPAGMNKFADDLGEENMPVDGSRICLLDFDYSPSTRESREYTIEVGDNEPELLTEQLGNIEVEVAMERRRTVRARGRNGGLAARTSLTRSQTAASPPNQSHIDEVMRRQIVTHPSPGEEIVSPLSRSSGLSRSQTAAGFQHARFPPRPPLGSSFTDSSVPGSRPHHRASVDSWETPPPPYGHDSLAVPSFGQRPHTASQASSHSATLNGNLAQLGTFQPRALPQQHLGTVQTQALQLGRSTQYARQSTSMDGTMLSEHGPSQSMGQYGPAARSPRPDNIPEETVEHDPNYRYPQANRQSHVSPISAPDVPPPGSYFEEAVQAHGTHPREEGLTLRSTLTHPISPPTPDRQSWMPDQPQGQSPRLPTPTSAGRSENRISLTGANLQNRLNHPVPPVPVNESPASRHETRSSPPQHHLQQFSQSQTTSQQYQYQHDSNRPSYNTGTTPQSLHTYTHPIAPSIPTAEQMARLSRHQSSLPSPLQPGHRPGGSSATHDFACSPSPTPRAAWGAAGVPGTVSFTRALAMPNGVSRSSSRGSNRSIGASRSTPNLFTPSMGLGHSPRPSYPRLDTINSIGSAGLGARLEYERSRSAIGYHNEFGRSATDPNVVLEQPMMERRVGKKGKKEKSGRKCIVM
ncbi:hypothetical protein LTR64_008674 [Lithohypha guttulata]|uniref:uncharacterized protein n=1 Tax=Lithohypha guttulata TaxID=1690604 RepID=UPI002DDE44FA|nr:hypothetical protein LTR51_008720 [Lithohypha guttulata]